MNNWTEYDVKIKKYMFAIRNDRRVRSKRIKNLLKKKNKMARNDLYCSLY